MKKFIQNIFKNQNFLKTLIKILFKIEILWKILWKNF